MGGEREEEREREREKSHSSRVYAGVCSSVASAQRSGVYDNVRQFGKCTLKQAAAPSAIESKGIAMTLQSILSTLHMWD